MGPQRYPYGSALGFVNQFNYSGGTAGNISGSATPNVTLGGLFYTNNTAALTITNFLLDDTANRLSNYEGKLIRVFFLDTATQIDNSGSLQLQGTDNLIGANNQIELMFSRGTWFEVDRSRPNRTEVSTVVMTVASSYNVDGIRVLILNNTGSVTRPVIAFSGGQVGQEISVLRASSNAILVQTGGNIAFAAGTNAFVLNASGIYKFLKRDNTTWNLLYQSTAGGII